MNMDQRGTHQEIDVTADLTNISVQNPFNDIQLSIIQNRNWTSLRSLSPRFLRNGIIDFNYNNGENSFAGGNIFRFADSKNIPIPSLRIRKFELKELWVANVMEEKPRGINPFLFQDDSRGGYVIRKQNSNQPETEADYILLDVFLKDIEIGKIMSLAYDKTINKYFGIAIIKLVHLYNFEENSDLECYHEESKIKIRFPQYLLPLPKKS